MDCPCPVVLDLLERLSKRCYELRNMVNSGAKIKFLYEKVVQMDVNAGFILNQCSVGGVMSGVVDRISSAKRLLGDLLSDNEELVDFPISRFKNISDQLVLLLTETSGLLEGLISAYRDQCYGLFRR